MLQISELSIQFFEKYGIKFTFCVNTGCRQSTVRRTNHRLAYRNVLAAVGWYSLLENNFRRVLLRIVTLYIKIFNLKTSELS